MTDLFVLAVLSQGITVLDKTYYVAWHCQNNHALVTYTLEGGTDLNEVSQKFDTELDAHTYILGLKSLHQEDKADWRTI